MNLHKPVSFPERSFAEKRISEAPGSDTRFALTSLLRGRAFFVTGAGSSAGTPTDLPTGRELAEHLVSWAGGMGFVDEMAGLEDPNDLGQVCETLNVALNRPTVLEEIRDSVDWEGRDINLCHLAIAMFFAEGAISVSFTVNWDPKLSDAFKRVSGEHPPRIAHDKTSMAMVGNHPYLVHLHGLWPDMDSLVMTTSELTKNTAVQWTETNLRTALVSKDAILVGFAAEPRYVLKSLSDMREVMDSPPTSVIGREDIDTFSANSPGLSEAIRLSEDRDRYIQGEACEILGELLRCYYRKQIGTVLDAAEQKVQATNGLQAKFNPAGRERLEAALGELSLEDLLGLLWSSTARTTEEGTCRQMTLASASPGLAEILACVMVLAGIDGVTGFRASRFGFSLETDATGLVELWPVIPEGDLNPGEARKRASRHNDHFAGPGKALVPLVLICGGTVGGIPPSDKVSLIGTGIGKAERVESGDRIPKDTITLPALDERLAEHEGTIQIEEALTL